jgi:hypothetical protein
MQNNGHIFGPTLERFLTHGRQRAARAPRTKLLSQNHSRPPIAPAAHSLHEISYRACFKPQLPRFFIQRLTGSGGIVYDPGLARPPK